MRRLRKKADATRASDTQLQEKLIEKYFHQLDLEDLQGYSADLDFDSNRVYNAINNAIDTSDETPAKNHTWWWLSGVAALLALATTTYYLRFEILNYLSPVHNMQLTALPGNMSKIVLGDGTKVWLNSGSTLHYPETFRGEKREVVITGEAFFDVKHDAKHPFIVHTGDISTQVLGTSFGVKSYPADEAIEVNVSSGKVGIVPDDNKSLDFATVYLNAAQGMAYNKQSHSIIKHDHIDADIANGWVNGKFAFKNTALPDVIKTLNRKFNFGLVADKNLLNCTITADLTNVPPQDILNIIARLVRGKVTFKGKQHHLSGLGCQ